MSIQSSINQMLGNVGLLANTFQFQNQIKKTEEISSQVSRLNEQRAKLEADKEKFKTESDEERAKLGKEKSDIKDYADLTMRQINDAWKGVSPQQLEQSGLVDLWSDNAYAAGNAMASNVAQQRVDAERQKRINQVEALKKAMNGHSWSNFKLVHSRGTRKIVDEEAVIKICKEAGIDPFVKSKLAGITELTKRIGKDKINGLIGPYINMQAGSVVLVPRNDPREEATIKKEGE